MYVQNNVNALNLFNNMNTQNQESMLNTSLAKLSSTLQMNLAAEDVENVSITDQMKTQLKKSAGEQSTEDVQLTKFDKINAELDEADSMLERMNELSEQALKGDYSDDERADMNIEYQQLSDEVNQVMVSVGKESVSLFSDNESSVSDSESSINEEQVSFVYQTDDVDSYLANLNSFLDQVNEAVENNDYEAAKTLGIDLTDDLTNSQRLRQAVANFTTQQFDEESGSEQETGTFAITVSDDNVSIALNLGDDDYFQLEDTNILSKDASATAGETVKSAIDSIADIRSEFKSIETSVEGEIRRRLQDMEATLTDSGSTIQNADMAKEALEAIKKQMITDANSVLMSQNDLQSESVIHLLN